MKRLFYLLLSLTLLFSCSCSHAEGEELLGGYHGLTFVSEEEMQSWREPIARFCREHDPANYGEDAWITDTLGFSLSLLDMDLDGVPEILVNHGGGSSGNVLYQVYDLYTGEYLSSLGGGIDCDLCVYYDTETGALRHIQQYPIRFGWESTTYRVSAVALSHEDCESSLFTVKSTLIDPFSEDWYTRLDYRVNDEVVSGEDFYSSYQSFFRTNVRIPETAHRCVYWWDLEGYDSRLSTEELIPLMTDALLGSGQRFIASITQ